MSGAALLRLLRHARRPGSAALRAACSPGLASGDVQASAQASYVSKVRRALECYHSLFAQEVHSSTMWRAREHAMQGIDGSHDRCSSGRASASAWPPQRPSRPLKPRAPQQQRPRQ